MRYTNRRIFFFVGSRILKVVDNVADISSDAWLDACDNIGSLGSSNKLMPYRLTEQFRINVEKDNEPAVKVVRLHS